MTRKLLLTAATILAITSTTLPANADSAWMSTIEAQQSGWTPGDGEPRPMHNTGETRTNLGSPERVGEPDNDSAWLSTQEAYAQGWTPGDGEPRPHNPAYFD